MNERPHLSHHRLLNQTTGLLVVVYRVEPAAVCAVTLTVLLGVVGANKFLALTLLDCFLGSLLKPCIPLCAHIVTQNEGDHRNRDQHERNDSHDLALAGAALDHDQGNNRENNGRDCGKCAQDNEAGQGGNNAQD